MKCFASLAFRTSRFALLTEHATGMFCHGVQIPLFPTRKYLLG